MIKKGAVLKPKTKKKAAVLGTTPVIKKTLFPNWCVTIHPYPYPYSYLKGGHESHAADPLHSVEG